MHRQRELRQRVHPTQRAAGWASALAWAAIGPFACFALLVAIAVAIWDMPVQDDRQFQGVLRPVGTPIGVDLPKNAVLKQIIVSQGDVIRKGETLALLDVGEMERRHGEKSDALLVARVDYLCVTSTGMDAFDRSLGRLRLSVGHQASATRSELNSSFTGQALDIGSDAAAACRLADDAWTATTTHDAQMRAKARSRVQLLNQKVAVLIERQGLLTTSLAEKSALAVEVLEVMLEHNQLERELASSEAQSAAALLTRDRQRLQQARALSEEIATLEHDLQSLAVLITSRRLVSPVTGIIARVRDPGPGHAAVARERVMELARAGGKNFRLAMTVPAHEIARLPDGARVELTLAGALGAPPLGGTLDLERPLNGVERAPDTVMVNLSGAARAWLASAQGTVALNGGTTASSVRLRLDPTAFGDVLMRAGSELWPRRASSETFEILRENLPRLMTPVEARP